jgi:type VI secretion system secreted protein VgrG
MGILRSTRKAPFLFEITGPSNEMSVVSFYASEWISLPFSLSVAIATATEIKSFDDIVGYESLLSIANNDPLSGGSYRYFHGVVRRFEHTGLNGRRFLYEADIVPALYLLSLRKNCRIFQNKTTLEIVKTLLEEAGITANRYRFALASTYRKRGFCVQYQESDLDFVSRLMEEEGIYYFFEHYIDKHVLVLCDNQAVHVPINGVPSITCNSGGGLVAEEDNISHFSFSQRLTPDAFAHSNFNFKKPDLDLTATKNISKQPQFEVYEYAAPHTSHAHGDALAKVRMEQLVSLQKQGHGNSSSCRLTPGYKVALTDHDSQVLNAEYLIIDVSHAGSQHQTLEENSSGSSSYNNQFTVIPAKTQFRPNIKSIKPAVKGLQTAIVVGPKGEEIHTDEYGRVKVQFHWDRLGENDDNSSCWLRVAQTWGGGAWGAQFIPRIGDEVLVDFLEGDPDRPIVTGCVYNSDNPPLFNLGKSITQSGFRTKTHRGEGFNELRFDDKAGGEEVYIHAERDFNIAVKGNETKTIVNSLVNQVGKTATISAGEQLRLVCGNASIVLDQSGKITIQGSEVFITGIGTLHLDGKLIQLNMGGTG